MPGYTSGPPPRWRYSCTWLLVAGQAAYTWESGTAVGSRPGSFSSVGSLLTWGVQVLPPGDYTVSAEGLTLVETPSADQAAAGEPLILRL